jgi:hypothetical protein
MWSSAATATDTNSASTASARSSRPCIGSARESGDHSGNG